MSFQQNIISTVWWKFSNRHKFWWNELFNTMCLNRQIWCRLAIGFSCFGLFLISIGIILRVISNSSSGFTRNTLLVANVLIIVGSIFIIITKLFLISKICFSKFKCCSKTNEKSEKNVKVVPQTSKHRYDHQLSGSVSAQNWSFHSSNDLKSSHQLLNEPNITECELQSNREYDLWMKFSSNLGNWF